MTSAPTTLPIVQRTVSDEWIDYNGHLNEAYYVLLFSNAMDTVMTDVGLGPEYRESSHCSLFTLESHVRYLDQILPRSSVEIHNYIIAVDTKKVVSWHEMYVDGTLRATSEVLGLHVDVTAGKAIPFPEQVRTTLTAHLSPAPEHSGRAVTLTRQNR